jgi:hypothetical protein
MAIMPSITRRGLLGGASAAALSLPFLSSLTSRSVRAAEGDVAKRLLVFFTPNEPIGRDYWLPETSGSTLTGLAPMMSALTPHMSQLLMVGDLEMKTRAIETHGAGHVGIGHMLTGRTVAPYGTGAAEYWASGISVDQHVADALGVDALTLGVRTGGANGNSRISYRDANQPVHPINSPIDAFDALFADAALPPDELAALRARRLSILDRVSGDLEGLTSKLPGEASEKIGIHLDLVRDLETKLASDVTVTCDPSPVPGGVDYGSNANFPLAARRQIDVMVQALACGLTDVASLQLGNSGGSDLTPLWSDEGININVDAHTIAHEFNQTGGATAIANRVALETAFFNIFGYLLDQLAAIPEGDGTVLDNTLVLWTKNLGHNHQGNEMLYLLAGGAGGALDSGRFVSFPDVAHNNLLLSVCQTMGLTDTSFGDPSLCTGPLAL